MRTIRLAPAVIALALIGAVQVSSPALAADVSPMGQVDPRMEALRQNAIKDLGLRDGRVVPVVTSTVPAGIGGAAESRTLFLELTPGSLSTFTLKPAPLFTSDFQLFISDDKGTRMISAPMPTTYRGRSDQGDEVWASIHNGRVTATIRRAAAPLNLMYVQPVASVENDSTLHAVYAASDVLETDHRCGVDGCGGCGAAAPRGEVDGAGLAPRGPAPCRVIRLNIDCDYPMYTSTGEDVAEVVRQVEAVMIGVNAMYVMATFNFDFRFTISRPSVRTTHASDPYNMFPLLDADADMLLGRVIDLWPSHSSRDLTQLMTGRDLAGSTIGLAFIGRVCRTSNGGLNQLSFSTNIAQRQSLVAHEMGHNFGMNHDGVDGFIMAPSISGPPATAFSAASVTSLNNYLNTVPACGTTAASDVQPDGATTGKDRSVLIDVLANDFRAGVACPTTPAAASLPSNTSTLGGQVTWSPGAGAGGLDAVLYVPPVGAEGVEDSFSYLCQGVMVPVTVWITAPHVAVAAMGKNPGLDAIYWDTRPFPGPSSWAWDLIPLNYKINPQTGQPVSIHSTTTLPHLNHSALLPGFGIGLSAEITGYMHVPTTGYWQFSLSTRSSARFTLNGRESMVVPQSLNGAPVVTSRLMQAGLHAIRVDYHLGVNVPSPRLILSYAPEGQTLAPIPQSALFREICAVDFNHSGTLSVQDIFDFLAGFFGNDPRADFNGEGGISVQDLFDFLAAYFAGCA